MRHERTLTLDHHGAPVRLHLDDYGPEDAARVVVCVHGLTRNGRDFAELAEAIAGRGARALCPDVVGRGKSDWLENPDHYQVELYAEQIAAALGAMGIERVDWVGTSMGGLIGMAVALSEASPIERLVLNDVGPFIPREALQLIGQYAGMDPHFPTMEAVEAYFRAVSAGFGDLTDAQWRAMAEHGARPAPEGGFRLAYDPKIAVPFRLQQEDNVELWELYDAIRCPTLVIRGAQSELLLRETAEEMTRRGPKPELIEIEGAGHAPALKSKREIDLVLSWLGL